MKVTLNIYQLPKDAMIVRGVAYGEQSFDDHLELSNISVRYAIDLIEKGKYFEVEILDIRF